MINFADIKNIISDYKKKVDQAISRTIDLGIAEINIELDKKEIGKLNIGTTLL